jgi:hypothetical protein
MEYRSEKEETSELEEGDCSCKGLGDWAFDRA